MTDLGAYSGPDAPCPVCGAPVVLTVYHRAAVLGPVEIAGHRPPCADRLDLARPAARGQHLCRVCLNCGHGWPEACAGHGTSPLPPVVSVTVFAFVSALVASAGASLACLQLTGPAIAAAWCVTVVTVPVLAGAGYALLTGLSTRELAVTMMGGGADREHGDRHRVD